MIEFATNLLASAAGFATGMSAFICYTYTRHLFRKDNPLAKHIVLISLSYGIISFGLTYATLQAIRAGGLQQFNWLAWTILIGYLIGDYALLLILRFVRLRVRLQQQGRRRTDDATGRESA